MRLIVPESRRMLGMGDSSTLEGDSGSYYSTGGDITQTPGFTGTLDTGTSWNGGTPIFASQGGSVPDSVMQTLNSGSSVNISQLVGSLSAAAQAAVKTFNATQSPGLIPGTNLVYNPATGAVINQAGTTIGAAGQAAASVASALSPTLIAVLAVGLVAVIALSGGRR